MIDAQCGSMRTVMLKLNKVQDVQECDATDAEKNYRCPANKKTWNYNLKTLNGSPYLRDTNFLL